MYLSRCNAVKGWRANWRAFHCVSAVRSRAYCSYMEYPNCNDQPFPLNICMTVGEGSGLGRGT